MVPKHQGYFSCGAGISLQHYFLRTVSLSVPFCCCCCCHFPWPRALQGFSAEDISWDRKGQEKLTDAEFTEILPLSCWDYFTALYRLFLFGICPLSPLFFSVVWLHVRVLRQAPPRWIPPPLSLLRKPKPGLFFYFFLSLLTEAQLIWSCHGNVLATVLFYRKA